MIKAFSKGEALRFGFSATKQNLGFFIAALILAVLVPGILESLAEAFSQAEPELSLVSSMAALTLNTVLGMGLIKISLKAAEGLRPSFSDLYNAYPLLIKYVASSILYGLIILLGFVLLIVPGIIWAVKYQFYGYLILDKGLGPREALRRSGELTEGVMGSLLALEFLLVLVNLLGILALGVGIFVTLPTSLIATAFVYRTLLIQTEPTLQASSIPPQTTPQPLPNGGPGA